MYPKDERDREVIISSSSILVKEHVETTIITENVNRELSRSNLVNSYLYFILFQTQFVLGSALQSNRMIFSTDIWHHLWEHKIINHGEYTFQENIKP